MISLAPYSNASSAQFGRLPVAYILPAPLNFAPATAINPTGPIPNTTTVSPKLTFAISTP